MFFSSVPLSAGANASGVALLSSSSAAAAAAGGGGATTDGMSPAVAEKKPGNSPTLQVAFPVKSKLLFA